MVRIGTSAFRTPAQRNRSIVSQMQAETERQRRQQQLEDQRLQREMQLEIQRQKLIDKEGDDRLGREFKVEQQRQRGLDQQRAPRPTATPTPTPDPVEAEQRRRAGIQTSPIPAEPTGPGGPALALQGLEKVQRRFLDPLAAAGLQIAESPAGGGLLGVTELKGAQRGLEELGVPERLSPLPRERTFGEAFEGGAVNPIAAALGNKEEQEKAQAVLEEAGLPRAIAAQIIFDPLNALPGVGFTKIDDVARLLGIATRATGRTRQAAVTALRNSDVVKDALRAGERGGPLRGGEEIPLRLPDELAEVPLEEPVAKLTRVIKEAKPVRGETTRLQRQELQRRAGASARALEGGRGEEAFIRARAAQRGELPSAEFEAVRGQFTEREITNLFEVVRTSDKAVFQGKPFNRINAGQTLFKVMNGELPTRSEIRLIEEVFGRELAGAIERFRPFRERAWRGFVDALNLPRTLLASFDVSFPLRQGVMTAARHPKEFFANFPSMFRAGFSEDFARHVDDIIRSDNTLIRVGDDTATVAELAESGGLFRATLGEFGPLTEREEFFLSTLARKIPGVRISERAFVTYGNKLRHDIFRATLRNWEQGGKAITDDEVQGLADLINKLTGRGTLGPANQAAPLLSAGFFAPRFAVSRPQAFAMIFHPQARVRNLAAQEIVSFVGTGLAVLGLVRATGAADVELDPRSSDFGKIKFGNTRLDFWGGNIQWARFVAQMITAQRKGLDGLIIPSDRLKVAERFARTKLSPPVGALIDSPLFAGENLIGEQFPTDALGIANEIRKRTVPLAIQDLAEAIVNEGMSGGLAGLAFVGVGAQTFESKAELRAKRFFEETGRQFKGTTDDYAILAASPTLRDEFPVTGKAAETQEFFAETAENLRLPEVARSIKQGNTQAGTQFANKLERYFSTVSAVAARNRFGEVQNASPEYLRWRDIDSEDPKYEDPTTFETDWDAYYTDKDAAFADLDPELRKAIDRLEVPGVDAGVLRDYKRSREARSQLADISKWKGLTPEQSRTLDEFGRDVRREQKRLSIESGARLNLDDVADVLAEQRGIAGLAAWFKATQSDRERARLRNPEYDAFIGVNQGLFEVFYPNLITLARLERLGIIEGAPSRRGLSLR